MKKIALIALLLAAVGGGLYFLNSGDVKNPLVEAALGTDSGEYVSCGVSLLKANPAPTAEEVRVALAGNLCRCTGYTKILEAVLAAKGMTKADPL